MCQLLTSLQNVSVLPASPRAPRLGETPALPQGVWRPNAVLLRLHMSGHWWEEPLSSRQLAAHTSVPSASPVLCRMPGLLVPCRRLQGAPAPPPASHMSSGKAGAPSPQDTRSRTDPLGTRDALCPGGAERMLGGWSWRPSGFWRERAAALPRPQLCPAGVGRGSTRTVPAMPGCRLLVDSPQCPHSCHSLGSHAPDGWLYTCLFLHHSQEATPQGLLRSVTHTCER